MSSRQLPHHSHLLIVITSAYLVVIARVAAFVVILCTISTLTTLLYCMLMLPLPRTYYLVVASIVFRGYFAILVCIPIPIWWLPLLLVGIILNSDYSGLVCHHTQDPPVVLMFLCCFGTSIHCLSFCRLSSPTNLTCVLPRKFLLHGICSLPSTHVCLKLSSKHS